MDPVILVQCEHFWKGRAKDLLEYRVTHDVNFRVLERIRSDIVAIILGDQPCTAEIMDLFPNLKTVARTGTGYNNVDLHGAAKRGIVVTRASQVNGEIASTYAVGLILALTTNMVRCHEDLAGRGIWERPLDGVSLQGLAVGIVGLGAMGRALARKLHTLGAGKILGWNRTTRSEILEAEKKYAIHLTTFLEPLMNESDVVVVVCAALQEGHQGSRNLIDKKRLSLMKPTAFFINIGRGAVVDEEALTELVLKKKIAGVALDVYSVEPPVEEPWFQTLRACRLQNPKIILTPHIASSCHDSSEKIFLQVVKNVRGALSGNLEGVEVVA